MRASRSYYLKNLKRKSNGSNPVVVPSNLPRMEMPIASKDAPAAGSKHSISAQTETTNDDNASSSVS